MNCCLREQLHLCAQPGQTQIFDKKLYYSITPRASWVCTSCLCAENGLASHPHRILAFLQLTWQDTNFWSWLVGNVERQLVTRALSLLSWWGTHKKEKLEISLKEYFSSSPKNNISVIICSSLLFKMHIYLFICSQKEYPFSACVIIYQLFWSYTIAFVRNRVKLNSIFIDELQLDHCNLITESLSFIWELN